MLHENEQSIMDQAAGSGLPPRSGELILLYFEALEERDDRAWAESLADRGFLRRLTTPERTYFHLPEVG